jgi:peroxiredoxin
MTTPTPTPDEPKPSLRPLILVLLGLVGVVVVLRLIWQDPQPPEGKRVGNLCPEVAGFDADDKPLQLSDHGKGKVVLLSFWATWCGPCVQQLPHEREMVTVKYKDRPFVLFGVAQNPPQDFRKLTGSNPLPWPNIVDEHAILVQSWGVKAFPSAVLVDHTGVIRHAWIDGVSPATMWAEVDKLVAEAERK